MKGVIIIGYQGIGKSSLGGRNNCIDLESGNFFIGDKRADDWYIPYCQTALSLSEQGFTVFVSSHKVVVDFLKDVPLPENVSGVVIFCPQLWMKDEWIKRLEARYSRTGLRKDEKALLNARERYTEDIIELFASGLPVFQPYALDYDLNDYVDEIRSKVIRSKEFSR